MSVNLNDSIDVNLLNISIGRMPQQMLSIAFVVSDANDVHQNPASQSQNATLPLLWKKLKYFVRPLPKSANPMHGAISNPKMPSIFFTVAAMLFLFFITLSIFSFNFNRQLDNHAHTNLKSA